MSEDRTANQSTLLAFAAHRTRMQGVITYGLDFIEHSHAASTEHLEIDGKLPLNHFGQRQTKVEEFARASDQILHQGDVGLIEFFLNDILFADRVGGSDVERNVDSADIQIARDVLPEIGKL